MEGAVGADQFNRSKVCIAFAIVAVLFAAAAPPAAAQFGAIRDAARRAADEAKRAEEARRKADEAKKAAESAGTKDQPSSAPAATPAPAAASSPTPATAAGPPAFEVYSKYDFVPGEQVVAFEDFSQDAIGDFPARWNTNAGGEIVTVAGQPARWLKLTRAGFFTPEFIPALPENVTVEFDLLVRPGFNVGFPLEFALVQLDDVTQAATWEGGSHIFSVTAFPGYSGDASQGRSTYWTRQGGTSSTATTAMTKQLAAHGGVIHVAVWRQRQRARVYFNEEKVWDVPRAVDGSVQFNSFVFFVRGGCGNCEYYLANLRVATGAPDTRNKVITEGKWVSHGILFDVNSDRLKGESYGSLKEIAGVLSGSPDLRVQIVGHTDSDGEDAANMDLSKRRAASVKAALASEFKIDAERLETDGKGETQPIDTNDTPAGKANNRRV